MANRANVKLQTVEWSDDVAALRAPFELILRQSGLAPCLPDAQRLEAAVAAAGGAVALAARCRQDPLARLGLLDLVPRPCADGWSSAAAAAHDFGERALPALLARQPRAERPALRVWCVVACRGAMAWRAALAIRRTLPEREQWDASVLATDFSLGALAEAQVAADTTGLAGDERRRLLAPGPGRSWTVHPELRRLVHFAWLQPGGDWPVVGPFEAIFCGDLLGLLAPTVRPRVIARLAALLRRRGVLYCAPGDDFPELSRHFPRVRAPGIRAR